MEKTLASHYIFEGRAVKLRLDTIEAADRRETTREIVEHADCIAVVAVDEADNVLLVKQFRQAVKQELLEIPAGGIDPGEAPETAVSREMCEETGYLPRKLERLGGFYSAPGFCTEYLHLYLVSDLVPSRLVAEDTEGIKVVPVPAGEIPVLLSSGKICDAKSIAGLWTYWHHRQKQPH